jgi:hypothetical protein
MRRRGKRKGRGVLVPLQVCGLGHGEVIRREEGCWAWNRLDGLRLDLG